MTGHGENRSKPVVLHWRWGTEPGRPVRQQIAHWCEGEGQGTPPLSWVEPRPGVVGEDGQFLTAPECAGFSRGLPAGTAPLDEARLFWPGAALHVVACEGEGCSWSYFRETYGTDEEGAHAASGDGAEPALRDRHEVLLMEDADRHRFLGDGAEPFLQDVDRLVAVTYHVQGRLAAWTLALPVRAEEGPGREGGG